MSINITIKIYTYMMEYYMAMKKKMNYCPKKMQMNLTDIMLNQTQKNFFIPFV